MRISDPNKLIGKVINIKDGPDMAEVVIDIGDNPLYATITANALNALNLNEGDEVFALFNSTDVTIIKNSKK
ncbi:MAG: TOBE domain-containing protein [Syntrophomonadaceae bacterium]|nr:TOBE domain-containing protein [Syntrophomonadaceae bacterium]